MFEESLVESTNILRSRNRWPAMISVAFQAALALALISLPMFHPEVLSLRAPSLTFVAPVPRPAPPPPPPQRVHLLPQPSAAAAAPLDPALNTIRRIASTPVATEAPPNFNPSSILMGDSVPMPRIGTPSAPGIRVVPSASGAGTSAKGPLPISNGVSAGMLLEPLHPVYPPIAIASHTQGSVVVQAIISKSGHIESAHVVSGPIMLQAAALDAVRTARYRPYLLNNQPTEVDTTFTINFRLGGNY